MKIIGLNKSNPDSGLTAARKTALANYILANSGKDIEFADIRRDVASLSDPKFVPDGAIYQENVNLGFTVLP